jgi:hypothetical protein
MRYNCLHRASIVAIFDYNYNKDCA